MTYLATFGISLAIALVATPIARVIALRINFVDRPSGRKLHTQPTPQLGGAAIILAFFLATAVSVMFFELKPLAGPKLTALLAGAILLAAMGFYDDVKVVPGWIKVPLELILGLILYFSGLQADLTSIPLLNLVWTLGWVIGITNAVNYLDNMDGLTAGSSAIAAGFFALTAITSGQVFLAVLSAAAAGCALGFLWYNRPPAKIFMGDGGSVFLGFLLAGLGLDLQFGNLGNLSFLVPVAIMAVPILDALMVSVSRVQRGLSPIHPGRDHISHRLVKLGFSPSRTVAIMYLAGFVCALLGLRMASSSATLAVITIGLISLSAAVAGVLLLKVEI